MPARLRVPLPSRPRRIIRCFNRWFVRAAAVEGGLTVGIFFEAGLNLFDLYPARDEGLHAFLVDL